MLRGLGDEPVPAGSLHRVRAGIAEGIRPQRRRWAWGGLLLAPAAIAVVLAAWFMPVRTAPGPAVQKAASQKNATIAAAPRIEPTSRRESSPAIIEPALKRSSRTSRRTPNQARLCFGIASSGEGYSDLNRNARSGCGDSSDRPMRKTERNVQSYATYRVDSDRHLVAGALAAQEEPAHNKAAQAQEKPEAVIIPVKTLSWLLRAAGQTAPGFWRPLHGRRPFKDHHCLRASRCCDADEACCR